ncbi:MAG: serine/threonine protein phosphatase [Halobacteriovorax sp.]|nr:serine/threonine protein phosphatase [Halobacteriovorax sp.]
MGLVAAGKTDIGMKRKTNQDSIYLGHERHLFVVADGMGGHNGGDIASKMAVESIPSYMYDHWEEDPVKAFKSSVQHANQVIKQHGEQDEKLVGMGTTVNGILFRGPNAYLANVGDSRSYLVNNKKLFQLSKDHSLVQEKLNLGIYDRVQAAADPQKNVLVRTVGFESDVEVDVFSYKVCRQDIFLSCSDGLHGKVSDQDILHIINSNITQPEMATKEIVQRTVEQLIAQANANGGNDNISVILIVAI